jgi:hypothetical protein
LVIAIVDAKIDLKTTIVAIIITAVVVTMNMMALRKLVGLGTA